MAYSTDRTDIGADISKESSVKALSDVGNEHADDGTVQVTRVHTSGDQGEFVHLGGKRYLRSDLIYAFGGTFNPGVQAAPHLKLGNPSPMGLFSFGTTTLILSFINAGARGLHNHNIMLGSALFQGGVIQVIAGIWELVMENTFGATVFTAYGGFWLSFAVITMNGFNIASSYDNETDLSNALGMFFVSWAVITFLFTMCTLRSTVAMFSLLFVLDITFILLAGAEFTTANGNPGVSSNLQTAAGVFGCLDAMIAFYNGMAGMMNRENSWINVKPIYMPGAIRPAPQKPKEA